MAGKCPKCEGFINRIVLEVVDMTYKATTYEGITHLCPHCQTVLSVSFDPIRLSQEVAKQLKKR